jgi:hypothetical protein
LPDPPKKRNKMSRLQGNQYIEIAGTRPSFQRNNFKNTVWRHVWRTCPSEQDSTELHLFDFGHELSEVDSRSGLAWVKGCVFIDFYSRTMEVEMRDAYERT